MSMEKSKKSINNRDQEASRKLVSFAYQAKKEMTTYLPLKWSNLFLLGIAFLGILGISCTHLPGKQKAGKAPNIIVFLVDDMGLMDTSVPFLTNAKGEAVAQPLNAIYRTPHMEKLAAKGVRFSNFYAHSVCSPSRSSIMTGQNSARHRVTTWIYSESNNKTEFGPVDWNWQGLRKNDVTLARTLQQAGYQTIHVGKAHFGPFGSEGENPLLLGFDVNIAGSSIGHPGSYYGMDGFGAIKGQKSRAVPNLEKYHGQDIFLTEALTMEAKDAITKASETGKPFFLNMAHYAVHSPFQSDLRFAANYDSADLPEKAKNYATLIEGIDKSLGDIVDHVDKLGLGEETLILFLGDNGSDAPLPIENDYSSSSPLRGKKGNHWEGGMRVPFIASWVKPSSSQPTQKRLPIVSNTIQTEMGTVIDLFPTLCRLAGTKAPKGHQLDGYELQKPLCGFSDKPDSKTFLNHFPHGEHRTNYFTSLVTKHWKIIYHYPIEGPARYELYDVVADPFESINLAEEKPDQLAVMMKLMIKELSDKAALYPEKDGKKLIPLVPKTENLK